MLFKKEQSAEVCIKMKNYKTFYALCWNSANKSELFAVNVHKLTLSSKGDQSTIIIGRWWLN